MKKNENKVLLPIGILAGAILGGLAGVLLAPASGSENRRKLKDLTMKMKAELEKRLEEVKDLSEDSYNKIVDAVVSEYSKNEPIIKAQAKKIKEALKGRLSLKEEK
ncbi:YtxH domain-containing protein [candidate division WWE3 bacterium]|nr:YtxH domain-containing protein [candidate division WWE3 bacterium]